MSSWSMQRIRNFVIPYFIYLMMAYLSPAPFQKWLSNFFPGLDSIKIDITKPLLPIAAVAVVHYLLSSWRLQSNKPFFDRVNRVIVQRIVRELGPEYSNWARVRPAFYHLIDSDKSLTYLSDRIKANGLVWFGFADLRLASILTFLAWGSAAFIAHLLSYDNVGAWIIAALISLTLVVVSALGSEITTRRHIQLVTEQLDQVFPLHRQELLAALEKGRE